jgi:Na+-translocating ferredoxin:NAD+ oxidoreductase RnfC subunit
VSQKRHTPEQIIHKLREAGVELSKGATVPQACKNIGVTDQTYYREPNTVASGWIRRSG